MYFNKLPNSVKEKLKEICPDVSFELKKRVFDLLSELKTEEHLGMAVVLGFNENNRIHVYPLFAEEDYVSLKGLDINHEEIIHKLKKHDYDGAILINEEGRIVEDSVMLCGNPNLVIKEMGYDNSISLDHAFGFKTLAGTRHISSITSSYYMPNAIYFVLSEEKHCVRIFYNAKIVYSPYEEEMMQITEKKPLSDARNILDMIPKSKVIEIEKPAQ